MTGDASRTLEDYDRMGAAYAADTDRDPVKAGYERPAMLAMAGDVAGKRVLDLGCASGSLTQALAARGAHVVGVDLNPRFVEAARARDLGERVSFHVADISRPMPMLASGSFDVVMASLVLHYLEDWSGALAEIRRVLAPGGALLVSTHHPAVDIELADDAAPYFSTTLLTDTWHKAGRPFKVRYYHRPLGAIVDAIADAGFLIERMPEPRPDPDAFAGHEALLQRIRERPFFLFVKAVRPRA
jgi:SAM-dependent methyltransferase